MSFVESLSGVSYLGLGEVGGVKVWFKENPPPAVDLRI
jgi:hypothetical protein